MFEYTRTNGLVASKSDGCRNLLRICQPLGTQIENVPLFEAAIKQSLESL